MERKLASSLTIVVVHTGTHQLKIIWNLIQENSETITNSPSIEKHGPNTHRHWTV